VQKNVGG